ncbi:MAG TPA: hypothetical protein VM487_26040, partial [Phycisphaerae bacterium]|nr:hypothetical protein [Phycisphaerae bacterium]
ELADQEFSSLRMGHESVEKVIEASTDSALRTATIDRVTLDEFLSRSEIVAPIVQMATTAGFTVDKGSDEQSVTNLARACSHARLATIENLEHALREIEPMEGQFFAKAFQNVGTPVWRASASFCVLLAVILAYTDAFSVETLSAYGWDESIAELVIQAAKEAKR